jgi:molybdate transport system ATP-binding protein
VVASGLYDTIGLYEDCSGKERNIALAWLRYAGLEELAKTPFERLSFGQQRLALLARAMVKSPPILILDEPCLGLDQHHRQHILALVDAIAASGRSQILFVSHIDSEVPRCINQRLQLVTHADGGYTATVS